MPAPRELDSLMGFLQEAFRRPDPVTGEPQLEQRAAGLVTGNDRLLPSEQVDIYRRQFWLRHHAALEEDYPGLRHLLDEDGFEAFCRAYLVAHPPRHPSLRDLGADIIAFAERYPDFPAPVQASAVEMVRYENAFVDIFDGLDVPALDPARLTNLPEDAWERARIVLHPGLVRLRLEYPVHRRRSSLGSTDTPPGAPIEPALTHLVLFRWDGRVSYEEIEPAAFDLLAALARGEPLVGACERIAESLPPALAETLSERVGPWFQRWTSLSWIVDVELPPGA